MALQFRGYKLILQVFANMSCTAENIGKEEKCEKLTVNSIPISVEEDGFIIASVEGESSQNGLIMAFPNLSIDENVLIDPKLLFIGSEIAEGSHATVYKGRCV
ncbi:serine threonine- kinase HT1-like [Olea europaea subsp. europaea]|uniref:Serine threonine- kinase HT1-like n=1 Tax=Olea europaea subsp. europaea TaxID=158383 RepID=A0A8S0VPW0_OLEEU|nr:serine threonine- kinase HT1-like [Olea europaea subsp. europaea]